MFGLPTSILRKDDGEKKEEKYKQSRPEKVGANKEKWFVVFFPPSSPAILVLILRPSQGRLLRGPPQLRRQRRHERLLRFPFTSAILHRSRCRTRLRVARQDPSPPPFDGEAPSAAERGGRGGGDEEDRLPCCAFSRPLLSTRDADFFRRTQLDLEAGSLHSSLSMLASVEGECVTTSLDSPDSPSALNKSGKRRVSVSGLHATYDEGLAFLKSQAGGGNGVKDSDISPFSSPETSPVRLPAVDEESTSTSPSTAEAEKRKTSILWLGSSIGNFTRVEAVEFLKGIELGEGDTMLIGVDGCADGPKIVEAYNDPEVRSPSSSSLRKERSIDDSFFYR
jgi:hypothetical protein